MKKLLVDGLITIIHTVATRSSGAAYRAAVDFSHQGLNYVAGVIRRHRKTMRSLWRWLNRGRQALPVLVQLRKGGDLCRARGGVRGVDGHRVARYVKVLSAGAKRSGTPRTSTMVPRSRKP
ncbi:hypothetical protein GBF35_46375 [Nonomuraea phyllanthi]|nr:hypothetical protein [Nonomuraea phyllanthi]QFY13001.1 hypothetical protein GBF35_46375 [Nonomuraea phyllanthi]